MGKVIQQDLFKKQNFDNTDKSCMHKPESDMKKETYKILQDFEIQMDYII